MFKRIDHIALDVADIERSIGFYEEYFDCKLYYEHLTGDGKSEIIVHTNEMDRSGKEYSFVRILKLNKEKLLRGIWSSKLKEEKVIIKSKLKKSMKTFRKIRFIKVLQFNFQASKDPTEIIMKGKKEIEETTIGLKNGRSVTTTTFKKIPFESKWYWNKKEFRYFLLNR